MERFRHIRSNVSREPDVLLLGDSIFQLWRQEQLEALFRGATVVNLGIVGARLQNLLWLLEKIDISHAKTVILMIGTNNLAALDKPCAILAGTQLVIERIYKRLSPSNVVVVGISPRGPGFMFHNLERTEINRSVSQLSKGYSRLAFVSIDDQITCHFSVPCQNYLRDNVHLSPQGLTLLGSILCESVPSLPCER
jgi:lysophospholipase L1-like esterase